MSEHYRKLEEYLNSEEFKQKLENFAKELEEEERLAEELERKSNLRYPNGEKVMRGDLFIDEEAKKRYEECPDDEPFGYYVYVYRINEDESVDICLNANFALKMNNVKFDFTKARLVERNAELYSPLDDVFSDIELDVEE